MRVRTDRYEWVYGRKPRGRGVWWFAADGIKVSHQGLYSEAKIACVKELQAILRRKRIVVEVLT